MRNFSDIACGIYIIVMILALLISFIIGWKITLSFLVLVVSCAIILLLIGWIESRKK